MEPDPDGNATVRMAMTDIGTGTYTILAQIAAEMLGLPTERVRVELGDTDFPQAAGRVDHGRRQLGLGPIRGLYCLA
jgi:CO/xanthine dehydrogenase Mo-binding subunit